MKEFIKTRQDVAKALNFGKYEVIFKDVNDCQASYLQ